MSVSEQHAKGVLEARAIAPEVYGFADDRPRYVSVSSWPELKAAHSHPESHHARLVVRSPALVINRWDLNGDPLPSYLRFDDKVRPDHRKSKRSRYIYASKLDVDDDVKVIDVHPLAVPFVMAEPEELFLCIEGCFKADALLSRSGTKTKAVMSVPSVTLWELAARTFAPYRKIMRKARVVWVIPDSDYGSKGHFQKDKRPEFINPQVHYQTDKCVYFLREQDINARFLVPPYFKSGDAERYGIDLDERYKVGIDDLLVVGGNLERWSIDNPLGVHRFGYSAYRGSLPLLKRERTDRAAKRDGEFLAWLTEFGGPGGFFRVGDAEKALGWSHDTVYRAYMSCVEREALKVWQGKPQREGFNDPHLFRFAGDARGIRYESLKELMPTP